MRRIKKLEENIIAHNLIEKFTYTDVNAMPELEKITVSTSLKDQGFQFKYLPSHLVGLCIVTGGKPRFTVARKSNAILKVREGMVSGTSVTLRDSLKLRFLDKLVNIVFPRIRDFDGFSVPYKIEGKSISILLKDPMVFPELNEEFESFGSMGSILISFKFENASPLEMITLAMEYGFPIRPNLRTTSE